MLYIDLETRSLQDLPTVGVYRYAEDPSFRILMAAYCHDDEPVQVALTDEEIRNIPGLLDPDVPKVAHNAPFERVALSYFFGDGWLDPRQWIDTAALAAEYGRPRSLEKAAASLSAGAKDSAGTRLINLFSKPNKHGEFNRPEDFPLEWMEFVEYCAQDVEVLRDIHKRLGDWPTPAEREFWVHDQYVNDRGMAIDLEMAQLAQAASLENKAEMEAEFTALTGVANPNSVPQVMKWANEEGLRLQNLQAEHIRDFMETNPLSEAQHRALSLRQEIALAAASKYTSALASVSADGRVRGGFTFFGAHTGRWSGKGVQPHNLPRLSFAGEDEVDAAICDLKLGLGADQVTLKKLVRALFIGPYTVIDFNAIEARVVAWLAGEQWALDAFLAGRDIYVETAQRMGGLSRSQGKVAVLALGYNGAVNSLRNMGAEGGDEELLQLVYQWRKANKRIVQLWSTMGDAIEEGGPVGRHLHITRHGSTMKLHLPSGRAIHYHDVKWERYNVKDPKTGKRVVKTGWRYTDPKAPATRIGTYGGRMVENVTQGVARDILAEALVRLHEHGYSVAGHVHDEVLVEGIHPVEDIVKVMCDQPSWATGLPIEAEGGTCKRYRKF